MATRDALLDIVMPIIDEAGAELYDLEYTGGVVKITVTKSGGIDLDTIGEVTRQVSRQFDLDDPISGRYTLEVTSPGLERTLRLPAHWASAIGEQVRVKLKPHVEGERRFVGTVVSADDQHAVIDVDGDEVRVDLDTVDRVRTVFVWGGQDKPAASKPTAKPKNERADGASSSAHDERDGDDETDLSDDPDHDNESENA